MNDAFGHPQSVVVLGGTSEIAQQVVALLAADRCRSVVLGGGTTSSSNMRLPSSATPWLV